MNDLLNVLGLCSPPLLSSGLESCVIRTDPHTVFEAGVDTLRKAEVEALLYCFVMSLFVPNPWNPACWVWPCRGRLGGGGAGAHCCRLLGGGGAARLGPTSGPGLQRAWRWENLIRKRIAEVIFLLTSMDPVLLITSVLFVFSGSEMCVILPLHVFGY